MASATVTTIPLLTLAQREKLALRAASIDTAAEIPYPAGMAANQAPKPTCLNRLIATPIRACSAAARKTAAARSHPIAFNDGSRGERVRATAPRTARTATRPTQRAADIRIANTWVPLSAVRSTVLNRIPCQYDGPASRAAIARRPRTPTAQAAPVASLLPQLQCRTSANTAMPITTGSHSADAYLTALAAASRPHIVVSRSSLRCPAVFPERTANQAAAASSMSAKASKVASAPRNCAADVVAKTIAAMIDTAVPKF